MSRLYETSFRALGGLNQLKFYANSKNYAEKVIENSIAEIKRIEKKFSRYCPESIISKINKSAGKTSLIVDSETAGLLDYAYTCFERSEGLFDITSGVLRKVWSFENNELPSSENVRSVLVHIGLNRIQWKNSEIFLREPGMEIDFGGIGKEYAVDRCAAILLEHGIHNGFVNLAGDLFAVGPHINGSPWMVGIQHPRKENAALRTVALYRGALASSGDYERFMEIDGIRYSHILNPKTGWPVNDLQAVTVQAESCLVAGSLATIAMLLGESKAMSLLKQSNVFSLIVNHDGKILIPPKFHIEQRSVL